MDFINPNKTYENKYQNRYFETLKNSTDSFSEIGIESKELSRKESTNEIKIDSSIRRDMMKLLESQKSKKSLRNQPEMKKIQSLKPRIIESEVDSEEDRISEVDVTYSPAWSSPEFFRGFTSYIDAKNEEDWGIIKKSARI